MADTYDLKAYSKYNNVMNALLEYIDFTYNVLSILSAAYHALIIMAPSVGL